MLTEFLTEKNKLQGSRLTNKKEMEKIWEYIETQSSYRRGRHRGAQTLESSEAGGRGST